MNTFNVNAFNKEEFSDLCRTFNNIEENSTEVIINYNSNSFFNLMKKNISTDRKGEVVFAVIRPNKKIITVTCKDYPRNIYRIPTGGIGYSENVVDAVFREVKEELGLDVEIINFAGVLKIKFQHKNESLMFYSYLFILKEISGKVLEDASDDEISKILEVDIDGLEKVVNSLNDISGRWKDWGIFRYNTSNAILQVLKDANSKNEV